MIARDRQQSLVLTGRAARVRGFAILLSAALGVMVGGETSAAADVRNAGDQWTLENGRLRVVVQAEGGRIEVVDKEAGVTYRSPDDGGPSFRGVKSAGEKGKGAITFEADFWAKGAKSSTQVRLELPDEGTELVVEADRADRAGALDMMSFLPPLAPVAKACALVVADYSNGHLYPLELDPFPARWNDGGRLDMPWVGVVDTEKGAGYMLLLRTPDDCVIECKPKTFAGRRLSAPEVMWRGSRGKFGYARSFRYTFVARGGYVALAKAYREVARSQGLLVTLVEKARANPNVAKLFGAADVWGGTPDFARKAKEAGVPALLVQGRFAPSRIKEINALGFVSSEYDNYTDVEPIKPGGTIDSNHDRVPEAVVLQGDGTRMKAWLTYDKKTQFMKRCPSLWAAAAEAVIPRVLAERPFLGRFIDVTTAEPLYECDDPAHPLTRSEKRKCGEILLSKVRSKGLVVGGEHGIWWAVPHLDYVEGMMSGNAYFAWPAGHLVRPKSRGETYDVPVNTWKAYDEYGIGHASRVPLWELVFHDCVVTTWYWGDSSDFLDRTDPKNQDRKDAFNLLYGSMPMLWANDEGSWTRDRSRFLKTCRVVGEAHRAIALTEMLTHEFVTTDRAVQRTRFSDGTEIAVNFGPAPRQVTVAGHVHTLPEYGYAAHGPHLDLVHEAVVGVPATHLRTTVSPPAGLEQGARR